MGREEEPFRPLILEVDITTTTRVVVVQEMLQTIIVAEVVEVKIMEMSEKGHTAAIEQHQEVKNKITINTVLILMQEITQHLLLLQISRQQQQQLQQQLHSREEAVVLPPCNFK